MVAVIGFDLTRLTGHKRFVCGMKDNWRDGTECPPGAIALRARIKAIARSAVPEAMAQSARFAMGKAPPSAIALSPTVRMGDKCKVIPIINNDKY